MFLIGDPEYQLSDPVSPKIDEPVSDRTPLPSVERASHEWQRDLVFSARLVDRITSAENAYSKIEIPGIWAQS